jgi:hypothetical protein
VRGKALIKASRALGPPVFARNLQVFAPVTDSTFFLRSGIGFLRTGIGRSLARKDGNISGALISETDL